MLVVILIMLLAAMVLTIETFFLMWVHTMVGSVYGWQPIPFWTMFAIVMLINWAASLLRSRKS